MPERTFDYIIAGAGAAGLSLLWRILHNPQLNEKKILLLDRDFRWKHEKTWCFWDDSDVPFKQLIHQSWKKIEVRSKGNLFSDTSKELVYHCIKSREFRESILEMAEHHPNVTLIRDSIVSFDEFGDKGIVKTEQDVFTADWIFQSVKMTPIGSASTKPVLQHFKGHIIETNKPIFDETAITLMDFNVMAEASNQAAFFYVLPYSDKKALIEFTMFSPTMLSNQAYDDGLKWYFKDRFSLNDDEYEITESEIGQIPMDDTRVKPFINSRTLSIGACGGATKPTTGYTFTRIQKHSQLITEALASGHRPPSYPESKPRFRFYDALLLDILRHNPEKGPMIFHQLFRHNSVGKVLSFLDEKSTLKDESRIFASLPWVPFLNSTRKYLFGRITP